MKKLLDIFKFKATKKNEKGMTLLEIMIVLAILGGITAALVGAVSARLKKANVKQAKIAINELGKALDLYYTDCNSYPSSDEGLEALIEAPESCSDWGPDAYIKKLPKDPWNKEFLYESDGANFTITSLGSDRREGGKEDAKDISSEDL